MVDKYVDRAFRIIRRNYGCFGSDGLSIKQVKVNYQHHRKRMKKHINNSNKPFCDPWLRTFLDERNKARQIHVYSVLDRWFQQAIKLAIEP